MTLSQPVGNSDAVLMELRGFSRKNRGVVYEIQELIDPVPLERVVFVVDETTDEPLLRRTVRESWDRPRRTAPRRSIECTCAGLQDPMAASFETSCRP